MIMLIFQHSATSGNIAKIEKQEAATAASCFSILILKKISSNTVIFPQITLRIDYTLLLPAFPLE